MPKKHIRLVDNAIEALKTERKYQDVLWGNKQHSPLEFLAFIENYCRKGIANATERDGEEVLDIMRKIGALTLWCMEQHGTPDRDMKDLQYAELDHDVLLDRETTTKYKVD